MEIRKEQDWVELTEIYNQDEAHLICGLLSMAGIPVKVDRESIGDIYGLTIGPLAKIQILVPLAHLEEAQKILAGDVEDLGLEDEVK